MGTKDTLEQVLKLKPDEKLDSLWALEAEKRLIAYREGKIDGIPIEEVF